MEERLELRICRDGEGFYVRSVDNDFSNFRIKDFGDVGFDLGKTILDRKYNSVELDNRIYVERSGNVFYKRRGDLFVESLFKYLENFLEGKSVSVEIKSSEYNVSL